MPTILGSNSASDAYDVSNSIRFNDDDSAYMQYTPSSASTSRKKWTWSGWVKRGEDPEWFSLAETNADAMQQVYPDIHASEYSWASVTPNYLITNDGTVEDLQTTVTDLLADLRDSNQ